MENLITAYTFVALSVATVEAPQNIPTKNWCTPGTLVMVPDGREGIVTSIDGEICRVVADGEAYATLLPHFIVEPVYPQPLKIANFGH